jgi:hypothetical protein
MQAIPSMGITYCFICCIASQYLPTTWQTSMSDLAKMWFQCIHESPEATYPMLSARRLDDKDVTDDAQQGTVLSVPNIAG